MTIQQAFNNFIQTRRLADLSSNTITDYEHFVLPFIRFVKPTKDISLITQEIINKYIQCTLDKPLSKATKATYIRNLKIFLKWLQGTYTTNYDYSKIRVPKSPKKKVKIYSDDEIRMLFNAVDTPYYWVTLRNKCIIALMYDSGLRQAEVCTLKKANVSYTENRMTVVGKGGKERIVPLGRISRHYMTAYLEVCPFNSKSVFVTLNGEELTCNAVKIMIAKLAEKLPFDLTSHKLRHNFATNYCLDQYNKKGSVDIYSLMYLMGHEDLQTTKRYLHIAHEIIASRDCISHLDNILLSGNP